MRALRELIGKQIVRQGVISFEKFMELALYCPDYGYYERKSASIGRRGDYFTSVSVGSLFGELLGFQLARWLDAAGGSPAEPVQLVEAGAHDGRLARDILGYLQTHRRELWERLEYAILEPSPRRREWQENSLSDFSGKLQWFDRWEALGTSVVRGVIFSNELLDAVPVRRHGWDARARQWFEWGVTLEEGQLVWARMPEDAGQAHLSARPPQLSAELLAVLPDGFTTESSPAAQSGWQQAARALRSGRLMTVDYGLKEEDFFVPHRAAGTLRAYHRHRPEADLLARPGDQDLTAHVNFTALQRAGESEGLKTESLLSQAKFLTRIAEETWRPGAPFAEWTPARRRQFQTLTHPEHLGRPFQALVQTR